MHQDERAPTTLSLLTEGELELGGRMPWSSNRTFLVQVSRDSRRTLGVYKPGRGERPLWDFPGGLYRREAAAWVLSELLGWGIVPETVVRDGPLGEGSVQRFVPADFRQHYFTLLEDPTHHHALRTICAFDLVANNTDRKSGHCLLGEDGRVWAIDNGLCFHPEPKIRTVIWDFAGEAVPAGLVAGVEHMLDQLPGELGDLLTAEEVAGVRRRGEALLRRPVFPAPDPLTHCYPWPLV